MGDRRVVVPTSGQTQPKTPGPVQEFSVSGGKLDAAAADRGESQAPYWRVVPASRLYPHESAFASRGSALLQQALHNRAVDHVGKQAAHWTRLSCHRFRANGGSRAAERARLQPRESLAAARAPERYRQMVVDPCGSGASSRSTGRLVKHARSTGCCWPRAI